MHITVEGTQKNYTFLRVTKPEQMIKLIVNLTMVRLTSRSVISRTSQLYLHYNIKTLWPLKIHQFNFSNINFFLKYDLQLNTFI